MQGGADDEPALSASGAQMVELLRAVKRDLQRYIVCVFPTNADETHVTKAFFTKKKFATLALTGLSCDALVFTGDDESVKLEFSSTFSFIASVCFVRDSLYMDVLNRLQVVEAELKLIKEQTLQKQLTQVLLERAEFKQRCEKLAIENEHFKARVAELEKKCQRLEKERLKLEARAEKAESARDLAEKGVKHYAGECERLNKELATYKDVHP
mgnify:CR=1 FL=1